MPTLYPSVNSATVDVLTRIRQGASASDATQQAATFTLLRPLQQRVVLDLLALVASKRAHIEQWITTHLRNPSAPLPDGVHEILALGIAQLEQAIQPPRLVVSSLVGQTTDQGFTEGMARLVNAILVQYSRETDAEGKAAHAREAARPPGPITPDGRPNRRPT